MDGSYIVSYYRRHREHSKNKELQGKSSPQTYLLSCVAAYWCDWKSLALHDEQRFWLQCQVRVAAVVYRATIVAQSWKKSPFWLNLPCDALDNLPWRIFIFSARSFLVMNKGRVICIQIHSCMGLHVLMYLKLCCFGWLENCRLTFSKGFVFFFKA